jgi:hypothetical protein
MPQGGMRESAGDCPDHRKAVPLIIGRDRAFGVEERADEYASLIADWVADGYLAAARGPTAAVMSPATDGGNHELEQ